MCVCVFEREREPDLATTKSASHTHSTHTHTHILAEKSVRKVGFSLAGRRGNFRVESTLTLLYARLPNLVR